MIARSQSIIIVMTLIALFLVACGQNAPETTKPQAEVQISGAGATFPAPLYRKWIEEYQKNNPDKAIFYESVGSGEGTKRFLKEQVDFGASDAAMSDEEMTKVNRGVKLIPATAGIIVLAYNLKGLNGILRLPRDVYVGIFAGTIKTWNDPRIQQANPGLSLPAASIILVTRVDSSGTTFAFTNHLSAVSKEWRDRGPGVSKLVNWPPNAMAARGNEGVAGRIKMSDGAIGYVEYGFAQRAGLAFALVENKSGKFVEPLPSNGQAALMNSAEHMPANLRMFLPDPTGENSYPIVTYTWLMLYETYSDGAKGGLVKNFVHWALDEGQHYSEALGFCSLPTRIVGLATKAVDEVR
ncbi:phosphate ABC transporter substrate-binding protein PstS [Desulfomonile tiedjei]|uniref:Phosphate-binding protein n=1 Tax=Desulfomonile tiedjei (strain ATCC 49306 / DSM 6799 / DCB-1) TaxID=706587 RepID=I4C9F3_DESTA|nr:phosphate ABC transporter substrate-binding protein PstS [Desulfomonile tiedjei]AFM26194.1 phosphate ABC transporter substrate-binding protein, PhoT family [Desulfomonile tiedjei DSM 6799]